MASIRPALPGEGIGLTARQVKPNQLDRDDCFLQPVFSDHHASEKSPDASFQVWSFGRLQTLQAELASEMQHMMSSRMGSFATELADAHEFFSPLGQDDADTTIGGGLRRMCTPEGGPISRRSVKPSASYNDLRSVDYPQAGDVLAFDSSSELKVNGQFEADENGATTDGEEAQDVPAEHKETDSRPNEEEEVAAEKKEQDAEEQAEGENGGSEASGDSGNAINNYASMRSTSTASPKRRGIIYFIVTHQAFEIFFSFCIILNCVTMGVQADGLVNDHSESLTFSMDVIEQCFVALFAVEIALRLKVHGIRTFCPVSANGLLNFVDATLVIFTGVLFSWVLPLLTLLAGKSFGAGILRTFSVFRAIRLLRIVRVIQKMPMFREVWLLLKGLTDSLRTLFWTVVVIFVITYIFAIFGCWILSNEIKKMIADVAILRSQDEQEAIEYAYNLVKGIGPLMQLLIQFLTLDSWNGKMERIMEFTPWCMGFFYCYIAVAVFVLMNLVTAIIVENAMSASKSDEDQRLKQMEQTKMKELKELEHLFQLMDADGDGTLDWEEFEAAFADDEMSRKWRLLDFHAEECKELFDLLDDGDGGIETSEFFNGLARMKGGAQSRDLMRVMKVVDRTHRDLTSFLAVYSTERGGEDARHTIDPHHSE